MKKTFSLLLALVLALSAMSVSSFAADANGIYVTIADANGNLAACREQIAVSDIDADGAITVNDTLYCAHEQLFKGGAAAGYGTATGDYGLYVTKLWGTANGSGFGYYVNNVSAWSLTDTVKTGDSVYAFVYTDTVKFSDTYSFFSKDTVDATAYESVEVTLFCIKFDAQFNAVNAPVAGAVITVDGKATKAVTDEQGKAAVTLTRAGSHIISAESKDVVLVPPVCVAKVQAQKSILTILSYYFNTFVELVKGIFASITK